MFKSLVIFGLVASSFGACPIGTYEYNSKCYYFQLNGTQFASAEITCNNMGGYLASIHDAFTNAILVGQGNVYFHDSIEAHFWVGANKMLTPSYWSWTDRSTFDFLDWGANEPANSPTAQCGAVSLVSGTWSAQDCYTNKPFVCEVPSVTSLTTTSKPSTWYDCGPGWAYFAPTQSCYGIGTLFNQSIVSWTNGEQRCQNVGAHLASVHSREEFNFVMAFDRYGGNGFWIGLHSEDYGATWQYTDGTPFDFVFWYASTSTQKMCAWLGIAGFYGYSCTESSYILCKRPAY